MNILDCRITIFTEINYFAMCSPAHPDLISVLVLSHFRCHSIAFSLFVFVFVSSMFIYNIYVNCVLCSV